jgi:hypothetical protein
MGKGLDNPPIEGYPGTPFKRCGRCGRIVNDFVIRCPACGKWSKGSLITASCIAGLVVLLFIANMLLPRVNSRAAPIPTQAEVDEQIRIAEQRLADYAKEKEGAARRLKVCIKAIKKAQAVEVIYDIKTRSSGIPEMRIGPAFYMISIDAKKTCADAVNCYLVNGLDKYGYFFVTDYRTGKQVAKYSYGRLEMD